MAEGDSALNVSRTSEPPACPTIYGCVQEEPELGIREQHSIWCPRHDPKTCPTCHALPEQNPPADVPFVAWSPSWRVSSRFTSSAV
jgi:hypothetical protein